MFSLASDRINERHFSETEKAREGQYLKRICDAAPVYTLTGRTVWPVLSLSYLPSEGQIKIQFCCEKWFWNRPDMSWFPPLPLNSWKVSTPKLSNDRTTPTTLKLVHFRASSVMKLPSSPSYPASYLIPSNIRCLYSWNFYKDCYFHPELFF